MFFTQKLNFGSLCVVFYYLDISVHASRDEEILVRIQSQTLDRMIMGFEGMQLLVLSDVPNRHLAFFARGHQLPMLRREQQSRAATFVKVVTFD